MIVSVKDVHKSFGKQKVLDNVSFSIPEPDIVALVGPNGSGKSTLMNVMTHILKMDEGSVTILGKSNTDPNIFRNMSFMQDHSVLYDYLTGYDHLQFIGDVQGLSRQQILNTAERVGMTAYLNKKTAAYSLGMKQHLLLTMALVNDPKLLILDEPLNGLDPSSQIRVRQLLKTLYQEGTTILLSSHNLAEIDRLTSHILFLKDGRLIKEDMSEHEQVFYELTVDRPEQAVATLQKTTVTIEKIAENSLRVCLGDTPVHQLFQSLKDGHVTVHDINKKVAGSEERYRTIFTKAGQRE
ncbi:ABC transporter ATP-binding protein [Lentibacillus saliphilus]|uniref:ABC transporter ATP-binding protein n=1 Tax=Lentibacillus saliphilus TaxID=2737028 RepID=UPI001C30C2B8|nr:ABC transporter ATP-binding protein [Lentibacillus saliphilus]